jgi:4-amino-4-deoxy-L-arabinose transferase-like glycosyltransferase
MLRSPAIFVTLLGVATLVTRLPLMTPRLAHWDSVNYALGLHDFNVAAHQPHPPGSPYYILLGRAVLAFVGDDNIALGSISVAASVLAVAVEFALGTTLFGMRAGVVAAVALAAQPVFWGYGTMATPWTLLALFSVLIAVVCARLLRGERELVIPSALLMAIASGFRLDVTVFLTPLWLWSIVRAEHRLAWRIVAVAIVAGGIVAWLIPVVATSGGIAAWFERLLALFVPSAASDQSVVRQFFSNSAVMLITLMLGIGAAVVLALCTNWRAIPQIIRSLLRTDVGWLILAWLVPPVVFLWLVDATEPGHALIFAGALAALSGGILSRAYARTSQLALCAAVLVVVQTSVFLFAAPRADKPPPWAPNSALLNVTAPGLRAQQDSLEASLEAIHASFDPADTVVLTIIGQNVYRFTMYYLPEFQVLELDPSMHSVLPARDRHQGNWVEQSGCLFNTERVRHAVLVVWTNSEPGIVPEGARWIAGGGGGPFQTWSLDLTPATSDYLGFELGGRCAAARARNRIGTNPVM